MRVEKLGQPPSAGLYLSVVSSVAELPRRALQVLSARADDGLSAFKPVQRHNDANLEQSRCSATISCVCSFVREGMTPEDERGRVALPLAYLSRSFALFLISCIFL